MEVGELLALPKPIETSENLRDLWLERKLVKSWVRGLSASATLKLQAKGGSLILLDIHGTLIKPDFPRTTSGGMIFLR